MPATRLSGSALVRHAVYALIAIASLEVAATLLLLPWAWGDFSRAHGEVAVFMTTKLVGLAAGAGLLLWAGRGDWRTWLLGVYCLLKATNEPLYMLQAFILELPPPPAHVLTRCAVASARTGGRSTQTENVFFSVRTSFVR